MLTILRRIWCKNMYDSIYFLIVMAFACLICLFFVFFNSYYNKRYLNYVCGSNLCVILSILSVMIYSMTGELVILKGITATIFCCGMALSVMALLLLADIVITRRINVIIIVLILVDICCYVSFKDVSVLLHKVIWMVYYYVISIFVR